MENATNALIMAAGILIGIMILSIAVFLFADFSSTSREIQETATANQLTEFNAQFTIYENRKDLTIYDVISVANLAGQNNEDYQFYTSFEELYKITIKLGNQEIQDKTIAEYEAMISKYNSVVTNAELEYTFSTKDIIYNENGRVKELVFKQN